MRIVTAALALSGLVSRASADCPRSAPSAVALVNDADALRATDLDGAIERYVEASRLAPSNAAVLWKLATAYKKKEAWADVASTLTLATKLAPEHADYFLLMGYAQSRLARWADAKASLEQAVKVDPNYADAYFELARVLLQLGDDQGALAQHTRAIQVRPEDISLYAPLVDLYLRLGFPEQAEQTAREGLTRGTGAATFALHTLYALSREGRGDGNGAILSYEAAKAACGPCNLAGQQIAYFNLGAAYVSAKPPRKAEGIANLITFRKLICKGAAASRYADECEQTQVLLDRLTP